MANLLQKASIVLTPTAYDNGKVLCAKPSEAPYGDFDFSRNSAATRVNAQGLVENVQILSSNLVQNPSFSEEGVQEVSNGSFSQEGVQLVTNGNFDTDSDWNKGTGWSISGGKANATSSPSGQRLSQFNLGQTINRPYKITISVSNLTEGGFGIFLGGDSTGSSNIDTNGNHTIYLTPTSTAQLFIFTNGTTSGSIDNVSCVEVGQDWDLDTSWNIGVNSAIYDGLNSSNDLQQTNVLNGGTGASYAISFEVTSGTLRLLFGQGAIGLVSYANYGVGVHTVYGKTTTSATGFRIYATNTDGGTSGSITNISVKEVGQNWDLDANWSIGNNKAISDATDGVIKQTNVGGAGVTATYKVQWTQNIIVGARLRFFARNYNDGGTITTLSITRDDGLNIVGGNCIGSGTFTAYVSSTNGYSFKIAAETGVEADITNITTIEITDDTNLPRINYEGFSYQDALGSEEVVNGSFDDGSANWTLGSSWSVSNGLAYTDGSAQNFISQNIGLVTGKTYNLSFDISNRVGTDGCIVIFGGTTFSGNAFANGTQTFQATANGGIELRIYGFNGNTYNLDNVSVKEYLGQEVIPNSGCGSWLWENQSTNLFPYSEDFSVSDWQKGRVTINSNQNISPDGTLSASKMIETTDNGNHQITKKAHSVNGSFTNSVFAKKGENNYLILGIWDGSSETLAWFDLENGLISTVQGTSTQTIEKFGDYYRCSVTFNISGSGGYELIGMSNADGLRNYTGDGTSGVYIWGAQAEAGNISSYIPTSGTSVTRNQDVCNNGGSLATINSTEGVLYFEGGTLAEDTGLGTMSKEISISDGTQNNRVSILLDTRYNRVGFFFVNNGVIISNYYTIGDNIKNINKYALAYKNGKLLGYFNGVEVVSNLTITTPFANNLSNIGFIEGRIRNYFYGKTKCVAVWKEALSDSELQSLTTI